VGQLIDETARRLFDEMRASRRDVERARQVLLTLRRLAPSKRGRGKQGALGRRGWFEGALQVSGVLAHPLPPGGPPSEELDRWRKLLEEGGGRAGGEAAALLPGDEAVASEGRRRRRRRRGGRRWLGQGEDLGPEPPAPGPLGIDGDVELDDDA